MKANAGKYDTFHIKLQSTIFGKKWNRVPCLYWVGVPCLCRHVEYYSMSDSPIFGKGREVCSDVSLQNIVWRIGFQPYSWRCKIVLQYLIFYEEVKFILWSERWSIFPYKNKSWPIWSRSNELCMYYPFYQVTRMYSNILNIFSNQYHSLMGNFKQFSKTCECLTFTPC